MANLARSDQKSGMTSAFLPQLNPPPKRSISQTKTPTKPPPPPATNNDRRNGATFPAPTGLLFHLATLRLEMGL